MSLVGYAKEKTNCTYYKLGEFGDTIFSTSRTLGANTVLDAE